MDVKQNDFKNHLKVTGLLGETLTIPQYPYRAPLLHISNMGHPFYTKAKEYNNTPDLEKYNKPMDVEEYRRYARHVVMLLNSSHAYAKTMHFAPHWYIQLGKTYPFSKKSWDDFMSLIFEKCYENSPFNKRPRYRLNVNGYNYFLVKQDKEIPEKTFLINVGVNHHDSEFDHKKTGTFTAEDESIIHSTFAALYKGGRVLEIGAGNPDKPMLKIERQVHILLDPSRKRLEKLVSAYPELTGRVVACRYEESFFSKMNAIVDLTGANKHLSNSAIEWTPLLLNDDGFALFVKDGDSCHNFHGWEKASSLSNGRELYIYQKIGLP